MSTASESTPKWNFFFSSTQSQVFCKLTKFFNFNHLTLTMFCEKKRTFLLLHPSFSLSFILFYCSTMKKHMDIMEEKLRFAMEFNLTIFIWKHFALMTNIIIMAFSISNEENSHNLFCIKMKFYFKIFFWMSSRTQFFSWRHHTLTWWSGSNFFVSNH